MARGLISRAAAADALEVMYGTGLPRPLSLRTFRLLTSGIGVAATMGSIATVLAMTEPPPSYGPTTTPSPLEAALVRLSAPVLFGLVLPLLVTRAVSRARTRGQRIWLGVIANAAGTSLLTMVVMLLSRWVEPRIEASSLATIPIGATALALVAFGPSAILLGPIGAWTSPTPRWNARGEKEPFADDFSAKVVTRLGLWLAVAAAGTMAGACLLRPGATAWQPLAVGLCPALGGLLCGAAIAAYGWFHTVETRRWLERVASGDVPRVRLRPDDATQPLALLPPLVTEALCDGVLEVENTGTEAAHPFRQPSSTPVRRAPLPP